MSAVGALLVLTVIKFSSFSAIQPRADAQNIPFWILSPLDVPGAGAPSVFGPECDRVDPDHRVPSSVMGFKSAKRTFTGTLKASILAALRGAEGLSKQELLARLRAKPELKASVSKLTASLGQLLDTGKIVQVGKRATARFKRA